MLGLSGRRAVAQKCVPIQKYGVATACGQVGANEPHFQCGHLVSVSDRRGLLLFLPATQVGCQEPSLAQHQIQTGDAKTLDFYWAAAEQSAVEDLVREMSPAWCKSKPGWGRLKARKRVSPDRTPTMWFVQDDCRFQRLTSLPMLMVIEGAQHIRVDPSHASVESPLEIPSVSKQQVLDAKLIGMNKND